MAEAPLIDCRRITKRFAGVTVVAGADFQVRGGEVHALLGENGAGKSTLLKVLAGVHRPDEGQIHLAGRPVVIPTPHAATKLGIALIHQEPQGFGDLTVAENVFLGHDVPRRWGRWGLVDWGRMRRETARLLETLGVEIDPRTKLRGLSIADQQMVELAAALSQEARVLLMDEPTAALTPREVDRLFGIVRRLRAQGVAIVFISHRLPEVFEIADRITVMRDSRVIATHEASRTSTDAIIREMVGRPVSGATGRTHSDAGDPCPQREEGLGTGLPPQTASDPWHGESGESDPSHRHSAAAPLLEVCGLTGGRFRDITLQVRPGEIVGLAGLVGAGRTDVARAIFGITPAAAGEIRVDGQHLSIRFPRDAIAAGIAYLPEDRQQHGLFLPMSITANTTAARLGAVSRLGWLSAARERATARQWSERLRTRLRSLAQPVRELSGGNQQKVVLGKWLNTEPRVLILDEPTRGIDVGAKAEVHALMRELAGQGKAILMISSDLPEVLAMSDRVLVMREGRLAAEFARGEATQEAVMRAATGEGSPVPRVARIPMRETRAENLVTLRARVSRIGMRATRGTSSFRELGIAAVVLLAFLLCTAIEPRFASPANLRAILLYIPIILVIAMGQMMVIISRNIDLSVGAILGFAAIVAGNLFIEHPEMPVWLAALAATAVGGALGLFNGILVALLRIPAIIATLGTLTAFRGLVFIYSGGTQVDNNDLPPELIRLSQSSPVGVPWIVLFAAAVALVSAGWMRFSRTGREIYAIGSNPTAAVLRGIAVRRTLVLVFTITGALSGVAGIMWASRFPTINPGSAGAQMELIVISAVVIGGVNVFGGSGTVLGVVFGCLLLGMVNVALPILKVSAHWQLALYGMAILAAAVVDSLIHRRGRGQEAPA